jgi:hypothetical protein
MCVKTVTPSLTHAIFESLIVGRPTTEVNMFCIIFYTICPQIKWCINESDLKHAELVRATGLHVALLFLRPIMQSEGVTCCVMAPLCVHYKFFLSLCGRSQLVLVHVTSVSTSVLPLLHVGRHVRKRDNIQEMKYKSLLNDSDTGVSHTGRHCLRTMSQLFRTENNVSGAGFVSIFR